ncbi:DUF1501 domain-containing protein [Rheinheimera metallidurans]|uniref:DUF1501 domain-containing protein n=1 Tax=Rheinheimera metallidurans TaxID=2925781 RepID=UPI00300362E9
MTVNSRRKFLSQCLRGGLGVAALSAMQLRFMQSVLAAEQQPFNDYKALVCIFLSGGNDSLNMLIPQSGESLQFYQQARQQLAISGALALQPKHSVDDGIALHPSLAPLLPYFEQRNLAIVSAVGSLVQPITKAEYLSASAVKPQHLFSHNDQQNTWMRGREPEIVNHGWGGQMLELLYQQPDFASCISLAGSNLWQSGQAINPFGLTSAGVPELQASRKSDLRSNVIRQASRSLMGSQTHALGQYYGKINENAVERSIVIRQALQQAPEFTELFPSGNTLAAQLRKVAQLISAKDSLDVKRQVFFVRMGGFDTHGDQLQLHPVLLAKVAEAMAGFQQAIEASGNSNNVTSFTMSDFGRTLSTNGNGTDHGWAGHQLVMGGAVKGGDIYGAVPQQRLGGDRDVGAGRIIPNFANEQYFATLAQWFGLTTAQSLQLFPNLANFNQTNLAFV